MKQFLLHSFIVILFLSGCEKRMDTNKGTGINSSSMEALILRAINGSTAANDSLSELINFSYPFNSAYNKIEIDSFIVKNKKYYSALIEYPNPLYNRFAIYDSSLNSYLIDQSLNGKISAYAFNLNGDTFIRLNEAFISKDTLRINRLSIYKIDSSSASLSFRSFTKLSLPNINYYQKIIKFTGDTIITQLSASKKSFLNNKQDVFVSNDESSKYLSTENIFDQFISEKIDEFNYELSQPQITDERSALASLRKTADNSAFSISKGFSLILSDGWKELNDYNISEHVKKNVKGFKYINNSLGAQIYIIDLSNKDSLNAFINYKLENVSQGNYKVRYSDKLREGKYFLQFFEYSCGDKIFLMIFETSRFTYEKNRQVYEYIINSFNMDC